MKLKLKVWRQKSDKEKGKFELHVVDNVLEDMSFFEMLDMLNNKLIKNKTGALFVIERNNSLDFIKNTGDNLYLELSSPIIESIFFKNSPLHDGAVIIDGNFITAARVILPVSENKNINSRLGLRHRAAFGITEKTIKSLKKADGLVVGSAICKEITSSLKKRQNTVTNVTNIVKRLKNKIK